MEMNRLACADDEELRPQVRLLAAGAVISVVLLGGSLGVVLGGLNDPVTPQLPSISPNQTSVPGFPSGLPANLPTDFPAGIPTGFPTDFPTGMLPTGLPGMPGGNP
jgi:hypothetical protein